MTFNSLLYKYAGNNNYNAWKSPDFAYTTADGVGYIKEACAMPNEGLRGRGHQMGSSMTRNGGCCFMYDLDPLHAYTSCKT